MAGPAVSLASYWRLVRANRNVRRLWLAQIISEMGDWLCTIAIYTPARDGDVGLLRTGVLLPLFGERIFPVRGAGLDPQRGAMLGMSVLMSCRGMDLGR